MELACSVLHHSILQMYPYPYPYKASMRQLLDIVEAESLRYWLQAISTLVLLVSAVCQIDSDAAVKSPLSAMHPVRI